MSRDPDRSQQMHGAHAERANHPEVLAIRDALAERVMSLRGDRGWSQRELARRANMTHQNIRRVEAAEADVRIGTVYAIAQALNVDYLDLIAPPD